MKKAAVITLFLSIGLSMLFYHYGRSIWHPTYTKMTGKRTTADVISTFGSLARGRLAPYFDKAKFAYPPEELTLIALKDQKVLEVWAHSKNERVLIKKYPIQATSGASGPKLREGDRQVPEGIYKLIGFNPNSAYHLSMKVNYPNAFDLKHAKREGREEPGTNIFIHGKAVSIGCLAMGDPAIEELFVLAHDVKLENITIIIAPSDPATEGLTPPADSADWVEELYQDITAAVLEVRI